MTIRAMVSRAVAAGLIAVSGTGMVSGCTSENVSCTTDACSVTLDRGVEAKASVLGVEVVLVEVRDEQVVLDVGGARVAVPSTGGETEVSGMTVKVKEVTDKQVVLDVSRGGGG